MPECLPCSHGATNLPCHDSAMQTQQTSPDDSIGEAKMHITAVSIIARVMLRRWLGEAVRAPGAATMGAGAVPPEAAAATRHGLLVRGI